MTKKINQEQQLNKHAVNHSVLTLDNLIPYSNYNINLMIGGVVCELEGFDFYVKNTIIAERVNYNIEDCKIILHPIEDIKKDEYNFIYENETDYESICQWIELDSESRKTNKFSYCFFETLFYYHFDVFGLIEKGLAISIHDVE